MKPEPDVEGSPYLGLREEDREVVEDIIAEMLAAAVEREQERA